MKSAPKAYKNPEFLNSPQARTIRILAEYLEPESRFEKYQHSGHGRVLRLGPHTTAGRTRAKAGKPRRSDLYQNRE